MAREHPPVAAASECFSTDLSGVGATTHSTFHRRLPMRYSLEKPEPTHCHWCTGQLTGLCNIYKGKHRERYYCSQECLNDGEERAAQYAIAGSRVQSHWYVAVAGMLAVLMFAFGPPPRA